MGKEQSIAPKENIISIPTNFIPAQELVCVCVCARVRVCVRAHVHRHKGVFLTQGDLQIWVNFKEAPS